MKNLKSLQVVALAGVAVALTAGCSSTGVSENSSSERAGYRWVSSGGWVPITGIDRMALFPQGWTPGAFGPVSYETYRLTPPAVGAEAVGSADMTTTSTASSTTIASDGSTTTVATTSPEFSEGLQPGDTFVEAAGASSDSPQVRRVILYTPFGGTGNR